MNPVRDKNLESSGSPLAGVSNGMKRIGVVLILLLAFFGLADSVYLTESKLSGTPLLCNIENLSGCNTVASSQYAQIFGIPLAEFGVLFYGVLFVLAALEIVLFDRLLRRVLQAIALAGVLASLYFIFVQAVFIKAFCIYCSISAVITFLVLILASLIEPLGKRGKPESPSAPPGHSPPHLTMPPSA